MTRRHFHVLAAVAVGLVALLFVLETANDTAGDGETALLLPGLEDQAAALTGVSLRGETAEDSVTLRRVDDGWVVADRYDYPADLGKLRPLVLALSEARVVEQKTANPEFYDRLGVGDPEEGGGGIKVSLEGGNVSRSVILGNTAQGSFRYARLAGEARSVLIDQNPDVPTDPGDWLVDDIIDLPAEQVKRVSITHADGERIVIEKADEAQTNFEVLEVPGGRELSYEGVANAIGGTLTGLVLEDVSPAPEGEPVTTTVFETFDGTVVTVKVHRQGEEGAQVDWITIAAEPDLGGLNARTAGWAYRLPIYKKNQLARRWDDLLRAPPGD